MPDLPPAAGSVCKYRKLAAVPMIYLLSLSKTTTILAFRLYYKALFPHSDLRILEGAAQSGQATMELSAKRREPNPSQGRLSPFPFYLEATSGGR